MKTAICHCDDMRGRKHNRNLVMAEKTKNHRELMVQERVPVFEAGQCSSKVVLGWASGPRNLATASRHCSVPALRLGELSTDQAKVRCSGCRS